MEFDPQDQDIITLLTKLKDVHGEYPENLLVAQRQSYVKRIMEMELGINGGKGSGSAKPVNTTAPVSTLLETALIVTIVAEAGVMAYFYRDKLADFVEALTTGSQTQELTPAPVIPTSPQLQGLTPSPAIASTASTFLTASPTGLTDIPTGTPVPGLMSGNQTNNTTPATSATQVPNGNNGHHYGQTPKPERTKENNGNNNPKDKPTKDKGGKPPKDKPTKTK